MCRCGCIASDDVHITTVASPLVRSSVHLFLFLHWQCESDPRFSSCPCRSRPPPVRAPFPPPSPVLLTLSGECPGSGTSKMCSQAPPHPVGGLSVTPHCRKAEIKQYVSWVICHYAIRISGRHRQAAPPRPVLEHEPTPTPVRKLLIILHSLAVTAGVLLLLPAAELGPWVSFCSVGS
jgi:hypothetical protein